MRAAKKLPRLAEDMSWVYSEYARLNKAYWGNRLPNDVQIYIIPVGGAGSSLVTESEHACFLPSFDQDAVKIELNEEVLSDKNFARLILMHEMVHVALRLYPKVNHGARFINEVNRISKLGALKEVIN